MPQSCCKPAEREGGGKRKVSSVKAAVKDKTQPRCSQGQRLILQVASLSPSSSCSCPRCATPRFTARLIPAQLWHVKLFTAVQMTRTALALWFFIIYVINPSRATLPPVPCTHDPLQSLPLSATRCDVTLASAPLPAWCTFGSMLHAACPS